MQSLHFFNFSSPPFLLALSFSPFFFVKVILEVIGLTKPACLRHLSTQMKANFVRFVSKKSVRHTYMILGSEGLHLAKGINYGKVYALQLLRDMANSM